MHITKRISIWLNPHATWQTMLRWPRLERYVSGAVLCFSWWWIRITVEKRGDWGVVIWEKTVTCGKTGRRRWVIIADSHEMAVQTIFRDTALEKVSRVFVVSFPRINPAFANRFYVFDVPDGKERWANVCDACRVPLGVVGMFAFRECHNSGSRGVLVKFNKEWDATVIVK